jgi:hypothetical protein
MIDSKLQSESQWVIEVKSLTTKTKPAPDGALRYENEKPGKHRASGVMRYYATGLG